MTPADMNKEARTSKWLAKKLDRLDFLAKLFEDNGFHQIADEIRSLTKVEEVRKFYDILKIWLF